MQQPVYNSVNNQNEFCGVITAWTEAGLNDNDEYSVLNVITVFVSDGKELKKLLHSGLEKENLVHINNQVDSSALLIFQRRISFMN